MRKTEELKRKRRGRAKVAPQTTKPLLAEVFKRIDDKGLSYGRLNEEAGNASYVTTRWRQGRAMPRFDLLVAFMAAAGLRFEIVDMDEPGK